LIDGPTEDFNLMLKKGRGHARVVRVKEALDAEVPPGARVAVYAWDEPVTVQVDKKFVTVAPHTLAWRALADGASVRVEAATALWMEMTR
jgi:environmental stress-induced protein Ves